jgi:CTP synthase (UTP-ammonia lyase)
VLGLRDAEHQETTPDAFNLVINRLTCSLVGQARAIKIVPGTLTHQIYGVGESIEEFRCNYGLNPEYKDKISAGGLIVAGVDSEGEVRIVELPQHRFFIATLFLPQLTSSFDKPHPLIVAYLKVAKTFQRRSEA